MNRWKIILGGAAMLVAIGAGCPSKLPLEDDGVEKKGDAMRDTSPIKIGWMGPLSGDAASLGKDALAAAQLAIEEVNAAGGVNGRMMELTVEDSQCSGNVAFHVGNKLIAFDQVQFIVGGICSGETLAVAPTAEKNRVIVFSGCSGSPEITTAGDYIFRAYPSDVFRGTSTADVFVTAVTHTLPLLQATAEDWIQKLTAFGGTNTHCAPGVYNSVHILADVMRRVGTEPTAVKNGLYEVREYPGVSGSITIDKNGDLAGANYDVKVVK